MVKAEKITEYNIYIDEAGDEGLKRGIDYFILTAVIVPKNKDFEISKNVDKIKESLQMSQKSQLHWNKIKGIPNKKMIIEEIDNTKITIINIIIDTKKVLFVPSKDMYYHFISFLFSRICDFLRYKKGIGNLIISLRPNLSKKAMIAYIDSHHLGRIDKNRIRLEEDKISIYPNSEIRLLQIADCCASSLGQAVNHNTEIACEIYKPLISKLYKFKGKILNSGIKFVPQDFIPIEWKLIKNIDITDDLKIRKLNKNKQISLKQNQF